MRQEFFNLKLNTNGQSLYEFTNQTNKWIKNNEFDNGIINISIQHTSASLIIQENADPDVQTDLINFLISSYQWIILFISTQLREKMTCLHTLSPR